MFFQYILNNVMKYPDKLAVKDSNRQLTYQELWHEALKKRTVALQKGVSENTKILQVMGNSCDWVTNFLAFALIGAKVVMISPESKEDQIKMLSDKLNCSYILTKENSQVFFRSDNLEEDIVLDNLPSENCEIVYHITSGSTDNFKICIRTIGQFVAEGKMFQERLGMGTSDVIVCPLPIFHSYAFGAVIISGLMTGAGIVLMERFTPRKYLKQLVNNHATLSFAVPALVRMLVSVHLPEPVDLSFMHYLVIGAGAITQEVFWEFREKYHLSLSSNYGSSETGGIITRIEEEKYPSIGRPMRNVEVQIRKEDGQFSELNEEGQLWVKAPSIMNRYFGKSDILDQNEYFLTGDLAKQDSEGFLFITGRIKNIVNIGGKKVNPNYVEDVMKTYPGINDVVVIGGKRKSGEEFLAALIESNDELDLPAIRKYLKEKIEMYMVPGVIQIVSQIPKNSVGKVERSKVLDLVKTELC